MAGTLSKQWNGGETEAVDKSPVLCRYVNFEVDRGAL
jgi:hypothetical protein